MNLTQLEQEIARHFAAGAAASGDPAAMKAFLELRACLERGEVRSAEPDAAAPTGWRVNAWVKQGILLGFRLGALEGSNAGALSFVDKHTFPPRLFSAADGVRVVAGGSAVRSGAYVARGVICAPPMWVNTGAYVDEETMVDSHALVGSCAQIGKRVHLSAAAQIGGVLEPVNASPVIIEDDVLVGGNCGVYEGTLVRKGAVLAAGTILTRGTPLFDLVNSTHRSRECRRRPRRPRHRQGQSPSPKRSLGPQSLRPRHRKIPRRQNRPQHHPRRLVALAWRVRSPRHNKIVILSNQNRMSS
jgi:2,3,4,5-tetrahydropyridine-2-carboxylate N-succinyltransferase